MMQVLIKSSLIFLILAVLQLTLVPLISVNTIIPDLVLIYVVIFALKHGQLKGTFFGFIIGFFFDIFSGGLLGSAMFAKTLAGFIAGYFYKDEFSEIFSNSILFTSIIFVSALVDSLFYSVLGSREIELNILSLLFINGIFPAVYTALIGFAYSLLLRKK